MTHHDALQEVLGDPRFAKNPLHWRALAEGEVPPGWPLMTFIVNKGMTTADGAEHRRLRGPVTRAFTPRRVEALRPHIEERVDALLDRLAETGPGPVDLREHFAYPLPMNMISDLLGIPAAHRDELHHRCDILVSSATEPADAIANFQALQVLMDGIVEEKRNDPADDLTSALIAGGENGDGLTPGELTGTLLLMFLAGHATTLNLISNAVRALLTHPRQLELARSGEVPWSAVVEETLRWDSPVGQFPMRYATEDVDVGGTCIPRGDAVLASYAAAGRDPRRFGPDAGSFDITREPQRHLSFGHGAHFCIGAPLARMEAETALARLFRRFPRLAPAVDPEKLEPVPSVVSNGPDTLPVILGRPEA
ncbi:cytochrome P450 family protein [Streptomyces meridianus]|uniref:Cytochrome P450 n=1 Tax=Streptomyces meridianus TaxID=2938945 RepID=A0ABT0XBN1_9ACTN|nr:cytochrome P450 [Streptomyces meridianus]MCM2579922.1 cytochrome P450 [Streptomyces meridianus]